MTATPRMLTGTPGPSVGGDAATPSDRALETLRLDGAIFFRAELTEAWGFESPAATGDMAAALRPARRD